MRLRASEIVKAYANRLAQSLITSEGLRAFRLGVLLHSVGQSLAHPTTRENQEVRIGLWTRVVEEGETFYVRGQHEPWRVWANVDRIGPKKHGPRVILLGESVARGFLFEPDYTPAFVLESILRSAGLEHAEVVDLARTSITCGPLIELAQAAMSLEPDALVVFAGNNWHPFYPSSQMQITEIHKLASEILDANSWEPATRHVEERLRHSSRALCDCLGRLAERYRIPVVCFVPEFNLTDWSNAEPELPMLPAQDVEIWRELRREAESALVAGDDTAAKAAAQQMLALDGGIMGGTFELLGRSLKGRSTPGELRILLEKARDAGVGLPRERSPRPYSVVQNTLRSELARYGILVVDLPRRFSEHLAGELPGRNLFLDYCHLNSEGIRVAMGSAAELLMPKLGSSSMDWKWLAEAGPRPSSRTVAFANFFAAYHNCFRGQTRETIEFYCREALAADPSIEQMMLDCIDVQVRSAPTAVCRSFERLYEAGGQSSLYYLSPLYSETEKRSMLLLIQVIVDSLRENHADIRMRVDELLKREHGVQSRHINLLEKFYSLRADEVDSTGRRKLAYFRSFHPESNFLLVCENRLDVQVTLTYRTPEIANFREGAWIEVNGSLVRHLVGTRNWTTVNLVLPAGLLNEGVNSLAIHWALPTTPWQDRLRKMIEHVDISFSPAIYPIYGDIVTLTAHTPAFPATTATRRVMCGETVS